MIRPFEILGTREEPDGLLGVSYRVSIMDFIPPKTISTKLMDGFLCVPVGEDVDAFVYGQLKKAGWCE